MNTEPNEYEFITASLTEEEIIEIGKKHTEFTKKMKNINNGIIIPKYGKSYHISNSWRTRYCNYHGMFRTVSDTWCAKFYDNNSRFTKTYKDGNDIERDPGELFTGRDQTESTVDYNPKEHLLTDEELHAIVNIPFNITNKKKKYRPLPRELTEEEREYIYDVFTEIRSYLESKGVKMFLSLAKYDDETIQRILTQMDNFMTLI